ncbi:hypothetical protein [Thermoactinomyces sp. DSM 45892]|uniref:hypothetical protein n=1 Tax=Thermoactinomyces sp. DSM 45892 TaxID=1882753 RepID=UPI00089B45DB|nr:hypothetical protein [Thermoactinomyces sp. DSM 45892]SDX96680.1 hypothetical protein SAMN05444416_101123 [Thermoactinomyces sp. DSM 45892]
MDKILAKILMVSIIGLSLSGSVLTLSIPPLFDSPVSDVSKMITTGSAVASIIFAVLALVFRRLFAKEQLAKK